MTLLNWYTENIYQPYVRISKNTGMPINIPVRDISNEETLSIDVDGFCNHAGEEDTEFDDVRFDEDSHRYINDDSQILPYCYNCNQTFIEDDQGGQWVTS